MLKWLKALTSARTKTTVHVSTSFCLFGSMFRILAFYSVFVIKAFGLIWIAVHSL